MHEAKTKLSQLVERAEAGEDIVIARRGKPGGATRPPRRHGFVRIGPGRWRGRVRIAEDFDELPEDIADALGAR